MNRKLWMCIGDDLVCWGDDLSGLLDALLELSVGTVDRWLPGGISTTKREYIRLYWGDDEGNLISQLLPDERVTIEDALWNATK